MSPFAPLGTAVPRPGTKPPASETITTVHIGLAPAESSTATRRPPSEPDDDPPPPPWDGVKGGKPGETP